MYLIMNQQSVNKLVYCLTRHLIQFLGLRITTENYCKENKVERGGREPSLSFLVSPEEEDNGEYKCASSCDELHVHWVWKR